MTRRQITLLVLGVIAFHVALFWLLGGSLKALPGRRFAAPVQPNFRVREARFTDEKTGEKLVYREIQVSTKLALPDALMERREGAAPSPALPVTPQVPQAPFIAHDSLPAPGLH